MNDRQGGTWPYPPHTVAGLLSTRASFSHLLSGCMLFTIAPSPIVYQAIVRNAILLTTIASPDWPPAWLLLAFGSLSGSLWTDSE